MCLGHLAIACYSYHGLYTQMQERMMYNETQLQEPMKTAYQWLQLVCNLWMEEIPHRPGM